MDYLKIAATPVFLTLVGLAIIRFKKLSWRDDVGFKLPSAGSVIFWLAAFLALSVVEELFASGPSAAGTWKTQYNATEIAVRIVAVGLIYPVVEEFFFRGVFLGVFQRRVGPWIAILVTSVIFGFIHVQYDFPGWIIADGILFGLCRVKSGSVYLPMLLHVLGNSYAVWERLT